MNEPFGCTIFCDDIRTELFNKVSLMGVYGFELLLFGDFPAVLPKLGIFSRHDFIGRSRSMGADVIVYFPGDMEDKPTFSQHIDVRLPPFTSTRCPRLKNIRTLENTLASITPLSFHRQSSSSQGIYEYACKAQSGA